MLRVKGKDKLLIWYVKNDMYRLLKGGIWIVKYFWDWSPYSVNSLE
jgi:hypothetical protein